MVDGERAYDRARAGEVVELKARGVTVFSLTRSSPGLPGEDFVTLTAHVSKGTYIRSLARDIARALGTFGHVTMLRRTCAGPFGLDEAISLDKLNEVGKGAPLADIVLSADRGLAGIPVLNLSPEQAIAVRQGRVLTGLALPDGTCWARYGNLPLALMQVEGGNARVERGFNFPDAPE
jgi:tRNA pseudouridine55 synthase